jgi:hypothetical protein
MIATTVNSDERRQSTTNSRFFAARSGAERVCFGARPADAGGNANTRDRL